MFNDLCMIFFLSFSHKKENIFTYLKSTFKYELWQCFWKTLYFYEESGDFFLRERDEKSAWEQKTHFRIWRIKWFRSCMSQNSFWILSFENWFWRLISCFLNDNFVGLHKMANTFSFRVLYLTAHEKQLQITYDWS